MSLHKIAVHPNRLEAVSARALLAGINMFEPGAIEYTLDGKRETLTVVHDGYLVTIGEQGLYCFYWHVYIVGLA